jgi:hypothetical protein
MSAPFMREILERGHAAAVLPCDPARLWRKAFILRPFRPQDPRQPCPKVLLGAIMRKIPRHSAFSLSDPPPDRMEINVRQSLA